MHPQSQREIEADGITLESLLHIGLWGSGPTSYDEVINVNGDLEQEIKELSGMKWQYAHTYYSEGEFWDLFNREWKIPYAKSTMPIHCQVSMSRSKSMLMQ